MNHTTIRLAIIIIAAATLMISGTIFYPMVRKQQQQQAYAASEANQQDWYNNKYGKEGGRNDGSQYLKCIVVGGGSDQTSRTTDGGMQSDSIIPGLIGEGGGISDNSCNNYDSGTIPTPTPTPSNCNGVEDDGGSNPASVESDEHHFTGITDPDTPQPPGVVCPPGEDEPSSQESAERFAANQVEPTVHGST